mgnify:CR=1 FL=1
MSEPVWFTRRVTFLWPVVWQGWALVLVPAAFAGLLMVVIGFSGAAGDALVENLTLNGQGITHRFSWLNQKGALENLTGNNVVTGDINLNGTVGIGVEVDGILGGEPLVVGQRLVDDDQAPEVVEPLL